jgi:hypothetical protein
MGMSHFLLLMSLDLQSLADLVAQQLPDLLQAQLERKRAPEAASRRAIVFIAVF